MLLTVSKRLEFSASRRLFVSRWTDSENMVAFGPETEARHGTGRNYAAYYTRCARPSDPAMRDANPVIVLLPGVGRPLAKHSFHFVSAPRNRAASSKSPLVGAAPPRPRK